MPKPKPGSACLTDATEAAHRLLNLVRILRDHMPRCAPDQDGQTIKLFPHQQPVPSLPYFIEAHRASSRLLSVFTDSMRWDVAGTAMPQGVPVGRGHFSSAHEVLAEVARPLTVALKGLLIDDAFCERVNEQFAWDRGSQSLSEGVQDHYKRHWRGAGQGRKYRVLVWSASLTISLLDVDQLATLCDCEYAIARRHSKEKMRLPTGHRLPGNVLSQFTDQLVSLAKRFLKSVHDLRTAKKLSSLTKMAVYADAGLRGGSRTRAFNAALALGYVDANLVVLPAGQEKLTATQALS